MGWKPYGLHIYSHNGTDWTLWYDDMKERDREYVKAKKKVGVAKSRKTPYRIAKKVQK